jgi:hypothetical protein
MEDGEKMASFYEDKKRERERQLKKRKKLLDGSSSEKSGDDDGERDETQAGAYDSLTPLGTTTRISPSQTEGNLEPEQIAIELDKIELNNLNTSQENTNSTITITGEPQETSVQSPKSSRSHLNPHHAFLGQLTGSAEVELDFSSEEEDSLANISHMQAESLDSCGSSWG